MPVIIHDEITVGGKKIRAKVFKSESQRPLTREAKQQAEKFGPFSLVESVGEWRTWNRFFDTPSVQKDDRIIEWIASKRNLPEDLGPKWLEVLMSAVRNEFPSLDTTVLGDSEIHQRLEAM